MLRWERERESIVANYIFVILFAYRFILQQANATIQICRTAELRRYIHQIFTSFDIIEMGLVSAYVRVWDISSYLFD